MNGGEPRERPSRAARASIGRLNVLRACLELLREYANDDDLFPKLVDFLAGERDYSLVWIGRALENGTIEILAKAGRASEYAKDLAVRWDGGPYAVGPSGRAISTQEPVIIDVDDEYFSAWRERARPYDFRKIASLPFELTDHTPGVLVVYSDEDLTRDIELLDVVLKVHGLRGALSLKESEAQRRFRRLRVSLDAFLFARARRRRTFRSDFARRRASARFRPRFLGRSRACRRRLSRF